MQQAIFEARFQRALRGKGPETDKDKVMIGSEVEVYCKPEKASKDVSHWRKNCVVVAVDEEGTVSYKWQGSVRRAPTHLVREKAEELVFLVEGEKEDNKNIWEKENVKILMDLVEQLQNNTVQVHGILVAQGEEILTQDAMNNNLELMKIAKELAVETLGIAYPAGVAIWASRKHIPSINHGGIGTVILWPRFSRKHCVVETMMTNSVLAVSKVVT